MQTPRAISAHRSEVTLLYLSQLIGQAIYDRRATRVARVQDLVFRLPDPAAEGASWPRLHGLVAQAARRTPGFFVPVARLDSVGPKQLLLKRPTVTLETFERRPGELLARELWDRRVIHCETGRVRRINEVVLGLPDAPLLGPMPPAGYPAADLVLLGVDIGFAGILQRLGLGQLLRRTHWTWLPPQVLFWGEIDLFATD